MPAWKPLPEEINGFKIVRDLGRKENRVRYALVICKACGNEFETSAYHLKTIKGCGCNRPSQIEELPNHINGFKIIEDLGYDLEIQARRAIVECKVCKNPYEVSARQLKYRKHCGCMKKDVVACKYAKSHPQLAQAIKHMMGRCYNKNNQDYYNYGARGITVCDEWLNDRNKFCEWSLNKGFENNKSLSIDRIDNNKGYSPDNCKWSTPEEQARNTRRTVLTLDLANQLRKDAKNMTYEQLSKKYNVCKATVWNVIAYRIWKE